MLEGLETLDLPLACSKVSNLQTFERAGGGKVSNL